MAIQRIPQHFTATCDGCKVFSVDTKAENGPSDWGVFVHPEIGYDTQGHAVGGYTHKIHLCPTCSKNAFDYIRRISKGAKL